MRLSNSNMNHSRRLIRTMATITSRFGKLSPTMFKGVKIAPISKAKVGQPQPLPSGYLHVYRNFPNQCNPFYYAIRVESRINTTRIVNFNANQLLLSNVFALSGFVPSSLEELLENADEEE